MSKFGIDVSKWQGPNFDFARAKREDKVEFVILRGAYSCPKVKSNGGKDSQFENYYKKCKALNLPVGIYQYSMATTVEQAKAEAEFLYTNVLKGKQFELPIYIDVEDKVQLALSKQALTEIVKAWCGYLEPKGFWVGIYAGKYTFRDQLEDSQLKRYAHWLAMWAKECTYEDKSVLGMWQFGGETNPINSIQKKEPIYDSRDSQTIIGYRTVTVPKPIAGQTVDQNYMYVDYPSKIKAAGLNGFGKPTASTKPKYVTYTVKKNDTLWAIAAKYLGNGVRYKEIKELNNLKSDIIRAGQTLKIPRK